MKLKEKLKIFLVIIITLTIGFCKNTYANEGRGFYNSDCPFWIQYIEASKGEINLRLYKTKDDSYYKNFELDNVTISDCVDFEKVYSNPSVNCDVLNDRTVSIKVILKDEFYKSGLKNLEYYDLKITTNIDMFVIKVQATNKPSIYNLNRKINISEEEAFFSFKSNDNFESIVSNKLSIVNENNEVIYDEIDKFVNQKDGIVKFKAKDKNKVLESQKLFLKSLDKSILIENSYSVELIKKETPQVVSFDYESLKNSELDKNNPNYDMNLYCYGIKEEVENFALYNGEENNVVYKDNIKVSKEQDGMQVLKIKIPKKNIKDGNYGFEIADLYKVNMLSLGEIVNIPDEVLKNEIVKTLGKNRDTELLVKEVPLIHSLIIDKKDIHSFEGIEKLIYLKTLYMSRVKSKNLKSIINLTNLTSLCWKMSDIESIKDIKNLVNLKNLYLSYNNINSIEGIEKLINLEYLDLSNNNIESIEGIENLINLEYLSLFQNKISNGSPLSSLENLESLDICYNNILDITFLKNFKKLQLFSARSNRIEDITVLKELNRLVSVNLYNNNIDYDDINNIDTIKEVRKRGVDLEIDQKNIYVHSYGRKIDKSNIKNNEIVFQTSIDISEIPESGISSFNECIKYDDTFLQLLECKPGKILKGHGEVEYNIEGNGVVNVSFKCNNETQDVIKEDGELLELVFRVKDVRSKFYTYIEFLNYEFIDGNFEKISRVINTGSLITFDGTYKGDLNGDGVIDDKDLEILTNRILKSDRFNPSDPNDINADIDCNMVIDCRDLVILQRIINERV